MAQILCWQGISWRRYFSGSHSSILARTVLHTAFLRFVPGLPRASLDVPSLKKLSPARLFGPCGTFLDSFLVPRAGLEPAQQLPLPPQDSVSTSSTTSAWGMFLARFGKLGKHFLCAWLRRNFMGKIRALYPVLSQVGGLAPVAPGVGLNLSPAFQLAPWCPDLRPYRPSPLDRAYGPGHSRGTRGVAGSLRPGRRQQHDFTVWRRRRLRR